MKLLKLVSSVLFVVFGSLTYGQSFVVPDISVSSNTLTVVAGPTDTRDAPAWATNTAYAQGAIARTVAGQVFFAEVAGTSTNVATGYPKGIGRATDGTVTWRPCLSRARTWLSVQDNGTDAASALYVFESVGSGTNTAWAKVLLSGGSLVIDNGGLPQGAIYVHATRDTKVVVSER